MAKCHPQYEWHTMRMVYLCERKGLPSLADQQAALLAAGLTPEEVAEAWVDRLTRRAGASQAQRDYMIGAAREGDEIHVSRPAVLATTEDDALRFVAAISDQGAVLCVASTGERYRTPSEAHGGIADALRLVAAIRADERRAVMEKAWRGIRGKGAGKPRIGDERIEAARPLWFDHRLSIREVEAATGISASTLQRRFKKRGSPLFGRAANMRRGK